MLTLLTAFGYRPAAPTATACASCPGSQSAALTVTGSGIIPTARTAKKGVTFCNILLHVGLLNCSTMTQLAMGFDSSTFSMGIPPREPRLSLPARGSENNLANQLCPSLE
jgi:hypothetical protein